MRIGHGAPRVPHRDWTVRLWIINDDGAEELLQIILNLWRLLLWLTRRGEYTEYEVHWMKAETHSMFPPGSKGRMTGVRRGLLPKGE